MSTSSATPAALLPLLAQLPTPSGGVGASPRFDGAATAVALSVLPEVAAAAIRALYLELEPVEGMVEGRRPFSLPGYVAAEESVRDLEALLERDGADAHTRAAVHAICGLRLRALSYEVPRWGRGRITQELHRRVGFLAAQQRRLMRVTFGGLDDAGVASDRAAGAQELTDVLSHWSRGTSDSDPQGLTVEVAGGAPGSVAASLAELAALEIAVQGILTALHARAPQAVVTLAAERVGGLLRVAATTAEYGVGADPLAVAHAEALVAASFGLEDRAAAADAGLAGERKVEGGAVAWVCWPPLP